MIETSPLKAEGEGSIPGGDFISQGRDEGSIPGLVGQLRFHMPGTKKLKTEATL